MKSIFAALLLLPFVLLFDGCASSPVSRIDSNREAYESWPFEIREAILSGRVTPGMTPEMVEMAVGRPSQVVSRAGKGGEDEVWVYKKSAGVGNVLNNAGISVGTVVGPMVVGANPGGGRRSSSADEAEVVFRNGVVSRADPMP